MRDPLLGLPDRFPRVQWAWQQDSDGTLRLYGTSVLTGDTLSVYLAEDLVERDVRVWVETAMRGLDQLLHPAPDVLLLRTLRQVRVGVDAADAMEYLT